MARIVLCFWSDGVGGFMRARVNMRGSGITGQTSQDFIADTDWKGTMTRVYIKRDVMELTNRSLYAE